MSDLIPRAKELSLALWAMGLWFFFFTISSLAISIVTVSYTMRWKDVDFQDRVIAALLIMANWSLVMMAFLSKAADRLQKGQLPIETGDSQILRQTRVASVETSEVKTGP